MGGGRSGTLLTGGSQPLPPSKMAERHSRYKTLCVSQPSRRPLGRGAAMEGACTDGGAEWQSLPSSIFDEPNIVRTDCPAFALSTGAGSSVTVEPQRDLFERSSTTREAAGAAAAGTGAGTGADACRMTGALLWDSAVVLASFIVRNASALRLSLRNASALRLSLFERSLPSDAPRCIELGAGLGLAGLTAAATLGAATTLTDRRECLPLLRRGILANGLQSTAQAAELEWGDERAAHALGPFDLVLASDCIYETEHAAPFVATLAALLEADGAGCALLAYDEAIGRPAALEAFFSSSAPLFRWEELDVLARMDAAAHGGSSSPQPACPPDLPSAASAPPQLKSTVKLVRLTRRRDGARWVNGVNLNMNLNE